MNQYTILMNIEDLAIDARFKLLELQQDPSDATLQDEYDHILSKIKNLIDQIY